MKSTRSTVSYEAATLCPYCHVTVCSFSFVLHFELNKVIMLIWSVFCQLQLKCRALMKLFLHSQMLECGVCVDLGQLGVTRLWKGGNAGRFGLRSSVHLLTLTLVPFLASALIKLWLRIRLRVGGLGGNPD